MFACHLQEQCNLPFDKGYHLYHYEQIQVFKDAMSLSLRSELFTCILHLNQT